VPSFENDIKPMFREGDRSAKEYYIDLWNYDEMKAEAENVLERVEDLSMPCDEPWTSEQIQFFRDWVRAGCAP
jgi:hypothetical protein